MADIYTRVDDLEEQVASLTEQLTGLSVSDSGWLDLTMLNGVLAYNEAQKPQYRKINNVVYLRGVIKNVLTFPTNIAILPEGFRPSKRLILSGISNGTNPLRYEIETTGHVNLVHNNNTPVVENNHYSLEDYSFLTD